ncbi:MAG: hypothetical protein QOD53_269 [Thermoleophilaceae bacterium]|nr:hypothetical protein [Thermoleophilaceae bacterium]
METAVCARRAPISWAAAARGGGLAGAPPPRTTTLTEIADPNAALPAAAPPRRRAAPLLPLLVAGCFALAALSLLLPSVPRQDSWSWIVWGREVVHLDIDTTAGSSWKPLPVLFTSVFSLFGDAAPELWLVVARAGGLLAILFAYRIALRLAGRAAGEVAAIALVSADWLRYLAHGNVEPLSAGLVLGAVDRHVDGHRHQAAFLAFLAALGRPEIFPFLLAYAVWMFVRIEGTHRVAIVALLLAVPALWLGGDWWGAGDPFYGSSKAAGFKERQQHRAAAVARRGAAGKNLSASGTPGVRNTLKGASDILMIPIEVAALVGILFAWRRRRREALLLAGAAVALIVMVATMVLLGYGGSPRFLFPAAGLVSVLAGVGVAGVLGAFGGDGDGGRGDRSARVRAAAVGAVLVAAFAPFVVTRVGTLSDRADDIDLRTQLQDHLDQAVAAAGGARLRALGHPRINPSFSHQLAWDLDVPMRAVGPLRYPAVLFDGPQTRVSPGAGPRIPRARPGVTVKRLAAVGGWVAAAVNDTRPGR